MPRGLWRLSHQGGSGISQPLPLGVQQRSPLSVRIRNACFKWPQKRSPRHPAHAARVMMVCARAASASSRRLHVLTRQTAAAGRDAPCRSPRRSPSNAMHMHRRPVIARSDSLQSFAANHARCTVTSPAARESCRTHGRAPRRRCSVGGRAERDCHKGIRWSTASLEARDDRWR